MEVVMTQAVHPWKWNGLPENLDKILTHSTTLTISVGVTALLAGAALLVAYCENEHAIQLNLKKLDEDKGYSIRKISLFAILIILPFFVLFSQNIASVLFFGGCFIYSLYPIAKSLFFSPTDKEINRDSKKMEKHVFALVSSFLASMLISSALGIHQFSKNKIISCSSDVNCSKCYENSLSEKTFWVMLVTSAIAEIGVNYVHRDWKFLNFRKK